MKLFGSPGGLGWPDFAASSGFVRLRFSQGTERDSVRNLSAATRVGDILFVAGDEEAEIQRLTTDGEECGNHQRLKLSELLELADPDEEADVEGLAADGEWLWVLGSHARTRPKTEKQPDRTIDTVALADLKDTRPRCLLARLPLAQGDGGPMPVRADGCRHAGMLKQGKHGNALAKALKKDALIGPFTRVPAKEGGVDMEGIAVSGERIAIGMRGPVIGTHALLIEIKVKETKPGRLKLRAKPVKRLLALEGLGIRDLKLCGEDLLILAGPTTGLSGPVALYRWRGWASDPPRDEEKVRLHAPERLIEIPFGRGFDHPEGLALWPGGKILVLNDSPAKERLQDGGLTLVADLFDLPQ